MNFKDYKLLSFFILIVIISIISMYFSILNTPVSCKKCDFIVFKNESASHIASRLDSLDFINDAYVFNIASKFLFMDKSIKPGHYDLSKVNNIRGLVTYLTSSGDNYIRITIPEGWRMAQIADRLEKHKLIDREVFDSLCYDVNFIKSLGFGNINSLEGYLFPETYFFSPQKNEKKIIEMMVNQFNQIISNTELREMNNFKIHELITLASIIQAEAGSDSEMSKISSVFNNRLNRGWKLAADPTIKYIIADKNRTLYPRDFKIDSPYNTYEYKGLPPGPINNPGFLAIESAINPDETEYLYFVLKSVDSREHIFNKTEKGHEEARKNYLKSKKKK